MLAFTPGLHIFGCRFFYNFSPIIFYFLAPTITRGSFFLPPRRHACPSPTAIRQKITLFGSGQYIVPNYTIHCGGSPVRRQLQSDIIRPVSAASLKILTTHFKHEKEVRHLVLPLYCYQSFVTPIVTFSPFISHSFEFSAVSPYLISSARTSLLICSAFFLTSSASLSLPVSETVI